MSGQSRTGGFFVGGAHVETGFAHGGDDFVETDAMVAIGKEGKCGAMKSATGRNGVSFDAGNLYVTSHRVTGEAEVMFHTHFGGIFNLWDGPAEKLGGCSGCHGAGGADFTLAAHFGPGDGGVPDGASPLQDNRAADGKDRMGA